MPDLDRLVAGMRCRDVLALLGEYVDGELATETRNRVDAHVRECDQCEKFGGEYRDLVVVIRSYQLSNTGQAELRRRLSTRIDSLWQNDGV
jgi:anti-sigma factor RsiW